MDQARYLHLLRNRGPITRLVGPITSRDSSLTCIGVQRGKIEWSVVHQHKISSSSSIYLIKSTVDAVGVIG